MHGSAGHGTGSHPDRPRVPRPAPENGGAARFGLDQLRTTVILCGGERTHCWAFPCYSRIDAEALVMMLEDQGIRAVVYEPQDTPHIHVAVALAYGGEYLFILEVANAVMRTGHADPREIAWAVRQIAPGRKGPMQRFREQQAFVNEPVGT